MKNVVVRSVFAVGMLLLFLAPGIVQAQISVRAKVELGGPEEAAKTAQFCNDFPETLALGGILDFTGFIRNNNRTPLNNVVLVLNTDLFQQTDHTADRGEWSVQETTLGQLDAGTLAPDDSVTFGFRLTAIELGKATTAFTIFYEGSPPEGVQEQCSTVIEDRPVEDFVEVDQWSKTTALVQLVGGVFGAIPRSFILRGETEAHVFFEGPNPGDAHDDSEPPNGVDEVQTELVALNLTNGNITLTLNPQERSFGQIQEIINFTPGRLDLPPFGQGFADSFFDVFFQIAVGTGLVLHNQEALQIRAIISHKPPYDRYFHLIPPTGAIELFDENNQPTGIFIVKAEHDTGIVEHDIFEETSALVQLVGGPLGEIPQTFNLSGRSEALVFFEGPNEGDADDDDGNDLDEVETLLYLLDLTDGNVILRLNPNEASNGQIEEKVNNTEGRLDLDPFHDGDANSLFDVFFEIVFNGVVLHNREALRIESMITEKPPRTRYVHLIPENPIELFNENNQRTGIFIVKAEHNTGFVEWDFFERTTALVQLVGGPLGEVPRAFILNGPAEAHVFFEGQEGEAFDDDGNGLDEVQTVLGSLDLTDGNITLTLNPNQASVGQIEEKVNNNPGWLDLDPFHDGDANSYFDVFFQIDLGGVVVHNEQALRIEAMISEKPPFERYFHLIPPGGAIELFDEQGRGTGIFVVRAEHDTGIVEHDIFEETSALVQLVGGPLGNVPQAFILSGQSQALAFFEGPNEGDADDDDGNGLDEVDTQLFELNLTDGNVILRLNPFEVSNGQIEEKVNNNQGRLDLDPFHDGDANSYFDVFFEIVVNGVVLHNREALRIESMIGEKPPLTRYVHLIPENPIELFNENDEPTGIFIVKAEHNTGFVEWDFYERTTALVQLVGGPLGNVPRVFILSGPAEVHVFFEGQEGEAFDDDGNRLDEVVTVLGLLNLTDGNLTLTLNPNQASVGQIEEKVNNNPGWLDLDPFHDGDANSFFNVFFQIDVGGGLVLHNGQAFRIESMIKEKPPFTRYFHLIPPGGPIELLDQNNQPTGVFIIRAEHDTGIVEHDVFEQTSALVQLVGGPLGEIPQAFILTGPAEALAFFEGPTEGDADDDDGNGLDEIETELLVLDLTDGTVRLTLNPNRPSPGQIEEKENANPGWLDLRPFHEGDANSYFDVFFVIEIPDGAGGTIRLFNQEALRIESMISEKPPFTRYVHLIPENPIELFDEAGNRTGIFIVKAEHNTGVVEWDFFQRTTALVQLVGGPLGEVPRAFVLRGPAEAHVFFEGQEGEAEDDDGNGLDEVRTVLGSLNLANSDSTVLLRLNPNLPSNGQIEEEENNTPGTLDLTPFAKGFAKSYFDVFFEIEAAGLILRNREALRIEARIKRKPPFDRYIHVIPRAGPIALFDAQGNATGVSIVKALHFTGHIEIERYQQRSTTTIVLINNGIEEEVRLTGRSTVHVFYEGPNAGDAYDDDDDGRGEVQTELVSLSLRGMSSLGPVEVRLPPDSLSFGETVEQNNNIPGRLDLDPFHPGNADAFLDVFLEVVVNGEVFHTEQARRISTVLTTASDTAAVYTSTEMTTLLDANGQPSTLVLGAINHQPIAVSVELVTVGKEIPTGFELGTNYPNPFNAQTVIPFGVPKAAPVRIEVYDVLGRRVATLLDEAVAAGRHEVTWRVQALPAGVYLIRLTVGNVIQTQRATLMK